MKMWMKTILNVLLVSGASAMFQVPPPANLPDTLGFAAGTPPGSSVGSLTGPTGSFGSAGPSFGSIQIPGQSPLQPTGSPAGPPSVQDLNPLRQGINFKDIADGFDGQNFNFGNMQTIPNSNERSCYKTCLDDKGCVMVVLCESNAEPVDPSPNSGSPLSGFKMMLPRKENLDCHVFYKVDTTASYSQNEVAQWGNECKYITYNPECRSPQVDPSWKKYQGVSMTSEHTISQKYTCVDGYVRTQDAFNEITCDKYGNITSTGGCTIDAGAQGPSQSLLPALGGNTLNQNLAPRPEPCSKTPPPCGDNAECHNTDSSYTCTCIHGYEKDDNGNCVDIDECKLQKCHVSATCVNNAGSFDCTCLEGYKMENDQCVDKDECSDESYECGSNSQCFNIEPGYECPCNEGYANENGAGDCVDIDECTDESDNCGLNFDCVNNSPGFQCDCFSGYEKDGDDCVDINECTADTYECGPNSHCVNIEPGYECSCNDGYANQNVDCVDQDECADSACGDLDLDCYNTHGSFTCTCREGFEKDVSGECKPTACVHPFTYMKEANLCLYSQSGPMYSFYNSITSCESNYENARLAVLNTHEKMLAVKKYLTIHYNTYYGWYFWVDIFQSDIVDRYPSGSQEVHRWGDGTVASPSVFTKDPYYKSWLCSEISYFNDLHLQESNCAFANEPVCEIPIKSCPNTFAYDGTIRFCFKLVVQVEKKEDAVTKCQDSGARLAQTNTDKKIMAVRDQMTDVSYSGGVFVGGYQKHHAQKEFNYWGDESLIEESLFAPGEPSDSSLAKCLQISTELGGKLGDVNCEVSLAYVCEIPQ